MSEQNTNDASTAAASANSTATGHSPNAAAESTTGGEAGTTTTTAALKNEPANTASSGSGGGGEEEAPPSADAFGGVEGEAHQSGDHIEDDDTDREDRDNDGDDEDAAVLDTVAANDVKNIILQVLSPYFDDDVGGAAEEVAGVDGIGSPTGGNNNTASGSPATSSANPKDSGGVAPTSTASPSPAQERGEEAGEDIAQRYDHVKSEMWIARICDGIMERLVGLGKPFKYVVHTMVTRKCGAGLHVCSSCYYAPSDGWLSHSHDLSAHLYAVVTVYWCAM
jgi:hypothetical protein